MRTATVTWDAESATSAPVTVAWVPVRAFTVALAADIADFDTVGTVITYTATVTNTGNQADAPDSVTVPGCRPDLCPHRGAGSRGRAPAAPVA